MTVCFSNMDRRHVLRGSITLAGAAIVLPTMTSLAGCSQAPASIEAYRQLISAVVDRVIPVTDTGGAVAADVPGYIAALFEKRFTEEQQSEFAANLAAFDSQVGSGKGAFVTAQADQQDALLAELIASSGKESAKAAWQQLRDLAIFGYYTSEIATEELAYEEIPGRYKACIPLAEVGGAWLERGDH